MDRLSSHENGLNSGFFHDPARSSDTQYRYKLRKRSIKKIAEIVIFFGKVAVLWGTLKFNYLQHGSALAEDTADKQFNRGAFSLDFPRDFEAVDTKAAVPGLILAVRHREMGFPTFNVIMQPGAFEFEESSYKREADRIVDSYRALGITDAALLSSELSSISGLQALITRIRYTNQERLLIAQAAIISGQDRHYILTYIDTESNFEGNINLAAKLYLGVKLEGGDSVVKEPLKTIDPLPVGVLAALIISLALCIAIYQFKKKAA
ncbi:MAG: hypothetical protein DCC75_08695 [Proteobacteria bacterium]|nr:MAG: hypothetical protein DCC75_08695 [Pseudomonadota bacterium]